MPTKKRGLTYNSIHHIYNRGVLKMKIFHSNRDYRRFMQYMRRFKKRYPIDIRAFCLMPNHFHFLIRETGLKKPITPKFMQQLQNAYARYYIVKYGHSGRLFQSTYKSKRIKDELYHEAILLYIKNNPYKDGLIDKSEDWEFMGGIDL